MLKIKNNRTLEFLKSEFIGKYVKVKNRNAEGKVIDETKNSLLLKTERSKKRFLKENCIFEFILTDGNITIDGKSILMRPEERIKIK